ncbi:MULTISPECIES: hypothetical protein [unclassified Streptomyces]|uniref:hypothetical protein n=1 Tax=unclassified Streptomyces TaxID=2593676 RepID=UPI00114D071A|nr:MULTISPECIES: hypothetical protein [unclassified Streptomyces]MYS22969.1 hypothetical protein [Streptomyces sp. SID4948]
MYFSSAAPRSTGVKAVLHDQAELGRFAERAAPGDARAATEIAAGGKGADFSRDLLVGWTATTGCSAATAANLVVSGERLLLRVSRPVPPSECLRPFALTVVFEVPKERLPARPVFG